MSTVLFFGILVILTVGIWLVALIGLWYGRELLKRQKILTWALLPYLKKMEQDKATLKALHIDKDEPLSKYQAVVLPDEVSIDFTKNEK